LVYLVSLFGSAVAWYSIENPAPTGDAFTSEKFTEFLWRLENTFYILLNQWDYDDQASWAMPDYVWLSSILVTFQAVFAPIVLINILIAALGDTYGDVKDNAQEEWHLAYAKIILGIEKKLSHRKLQNCEYWTMINNKRYLQVQDVDRSYFAEVVEDHKSAKEISEIIANMDTDGDGKLSVEELAEGERQLEKTGLNLLKRSSKEPKDGSDDGQHHAKFDTQLGAQDGALEGRLNLS